jgi:hypothetical protein
VKRPLRKVTPDTMVKMTARRQHRRSLVLRSFRHLSRSYFASEKSWEFLIEALLFAIIVATSAWPVFAAANAAEPIFAAHRKLSVSTKILSRPIAQGHGVNVTATATTQHATVVCTENSRES